MAGETAVARARRWPMIVLALASALATVGIVWLAVKASGQRPDWVRAAVGTPLALKCLAIIVGGGVVLAGLAMVLVHARRRQSAGVRGFHGDQGGTAAIEMALLFPFALIIFLTIIQATLLFNANMVIHYSAFAAARMATVVVPMEILTGDPLRDERHNLVNPPEVQPSIKLEMIRRAAVLALVPVSASLTTGGASAAGADVQDQSISVFKQLGKPDEGWFRRIKTQYDYADVYTKMDMTRPAHWEDDGNPDDDCPYAHQRQDQWTQSGWSYVPFCPFYHRVPMIWDYWYWEDLKVQVTYPFLLEVPYASRFLGDPVTLPDRTGNQYAATIKANVALTNEGGPELRPR